MVINMIRRFKIDDLDIVMKIWLESNIKAHDFIARR
jgi:putative acetyltransferase